MLSAQAAFPRIEAVQVTASGQAHAVFGDLLELALELVRGCACAGDCGCPACVQHTGCGEYNAVLHKQAAIAILELTLAAQAEYRARVRMQQVQQTTGWAAQEDRSCLTRNVSSAAASFIQC